MELLEGRQSIFAALAARRRRFEVVLVAHGAHVDKLAELLALAAEVGVPVKTVEPGRGRRDGPRGVARRGRRPGVAATAAVAGAADGRCSTPLRGPPLLLLLEGVDDARNLGFTLRSAEALGVHAVLIKKHLWDFDGGRGGPPGQRGVRAPTAGADRGRSTRCGQLQRRGVRIYGCIAGAKPDDLRPRPDPPGVPVHRRREARAERGHPRRVRPAGDDPDRRAGRAVCR